MTIIARAGSRHRIRLAVLAFGLLAFASLGDAQAPPGGESQPPPLVGDEIDRLIAKLQDPGARADLIRQLEALKAAESRAKPAPDQQQVGRSTLLGALSGRLQDFGAGVTAITVLLRDLPEDLAWLAGRIGDPSVQRQTLEFVVRLALVLLAAIAAEWLAHAVLARARRTLDARAADSFWVRLPMALLRLVFELVPIAAFALAAYGALPLLQPDAAVGLLALAIVNAHVAVRATVAVARAVLAPSAPQWRLIPVSDETANYTVIWILRLGSVAAYGFFLGDTLLAIGVEPAVIELFRGLVGLLLTALVIVLILQNRQVVAAALRTPPLSGRRPLLGPRLAEIWHVLAIVYVAALYLFWLLGFDGGFPFLLRATLLSLLTLAVAAMIGAALRRVVERGFALAADLRTAFPGLEARANRFLPVLHLLLRGALGFLTILVILEIWGVDSFDWLASEPGRQAVGRVLAILLVIAGAFVVSELVSALVERYLGRDADHLSASGRSARMRTLLPLLRNAFRILLIVVVTLIVLSELGIDIAPLLAGAGVVGLAIGFGAQTLVKDVITGFFILAEDTIAIGDVIQVDQHTGIVETMTIRTIRLRDAAGAVHTIPFSSVATIVNMTKDFSYAVFDVNIGYEEDIDRVVGLLTEIGEELAAEAAFSWRILAPIEVSGVERFAESAIVIRARIKTRPLQQWDVAREFNRRLKARFDREGIRLSSPQRIVMRQLPEDPPPRGTAPQGAAGA